MSESMAAGPMQRTNDGGVPEPWRIDHMLTRDRQKGIETFLVWPQMVPGLILTNRLHWNQIPEDMRPRRIEIAGTIIDTDGFDWRFGEWWGFQPTMDNFTRICAGYYLRVGFDQWGVKVEWA